MLIPDIVFSCLLIWCAITDWKKREIPDGALLGLLILAGFKLGHGAATGMNMMEYLLAVPLFLILVLCWLGGGIGGGDVKLIPLLCLYMGFTTLGIALFICLLLIGIVWLALRVSHRSTLKARIPLAPPLAFGCIAAIILTYLM